MEKRNREFTGSDERSGSSSNNNSRLDSSTNLEDIPQELLELDSMLARWEWYHRLVSSLGSSKFEKKY